MNGQPDEILSIIFSFLNNSDLMKNQLISKKWRNLIIKLFTKKEIPSIEQCIITSDYYNFGAHYLKQEKILYHKNLSSVINDKIFNQYYADVPFLDANDLWDDNSERNYGELNLGEMDFVLKESTKRGHFDIVKHVLSKYYNKKESVNSLKYFTNCVKYSHIDILKFLIQFFEINRWQHSESLYKYWCDFIFSDSVDYNEIEIAKFMIDEIIDIQDDFLSSILSNCILHNHLEIAEYLINKGADIHFDNEFLLRQSANKGYYHIVKLLLEKGADVHANNDQALAWSIEGNCENVTKLLLEYGAIPKN
jgi:hypothetical protein